MIYRYNRGCTGIFPYIFQARSFTVTISTPLSLYDISRRIWRRSRRGKASGHKGCMQIGSAQRNQDTVNVTRTARGITLVIKWSISDRSVISMLTALLHRNIIVITFMESAQSHFSIACINKVLLQSSTSGLWIDKYFPSVRLTNIFAITRYVAYRILFIARKNERT